MFNGILTTNWIIWATRNIMKESRTKVGYENIIPFRARDIVGSNELVWFVVLIPLVVIWMTILMVTYISTQYSFSMMVFFFTAYQNSVCLDHLFHAIQYAQGVAWILWPFQHDIFMSQFCMGIKNKTLNLLLAYLLDLG